VLPSIEHNALDLLLELFSRLLLKGALKAAFGTPVGQWGLLEWGVSCALAALLIAAAFALFRLGVPRQKANRRARRK
jgi:hypothetical protein